MTIDELKQKYGNETVMVVPANTFVGVEGFVSTNDCKSMFFNVATRAIPMLRYEAELDERYRQLVSYVVIHNAHTGKYFMTRRIKGDHRLIGKIACVGGHMDMADGLSFSDCCYRELTEECDFNEFGNKTLRYPPIEGYIVRSGNEVDRVHAGVVYTVDVFGDVSIKETEKLEGVWMTAKEIADNYDMCESWVQILVDNGVFKHGVSIQMIQNGLIDTFKRKNRDYGNAFYYSAKMLGEVACFTRMYDKASRLDSLYCKDGEQAAVKESILDTVLDLANYSAMTRAFIATEHGGYDGDKFTQYTLKELETLTTHQFTPYESGEQVMDDMIVIIESYGDEDDHTTCRNNLSTMFERLILTAHQMLNKEVE